MAQQESIPRAQKQRAQTVDKALHVLDAVAESEEPITLTELVAETGLEKTTTHRLARSLADGGLLRFDPETRSYTLGWRLIELGALAAQRTRALSVADQYLNQLRDDTGETIHLGAYDNGEVVYLAQKSSSAAVVVRARIGQRRPLHSTAMGKVLLAFGPDEWLFKLLKEPELKAYTENTIRDKEELQAHLRRVRRVGFAVDDEEMTQGIRCVAAPIMDYTGLAVAAISVTGPAFRVSRGELDRLTTQVSAASQDISSELGFSKGIAEQDKSDASGTKPE
ncbi:MAG: IclR family transcriptional regulator [Pseudomonadota bacterium]